MFERLRHRLAAATWLRCLLLLPLLLQGLGAPLSHAASRVDRASTMHCTEHAATRGEALAGEHAPECCEQHQCDCASLAVAATLPPQAGLVARAAPSAGYRPTRADAPPTRSLTPQLRPPIA